MWDCKEIDFFFEMSGVKLPCFLLSFSLFVFSFGFLSCITDLFVLHMHDAEVERLLI